MRRRLLVPAALVAAGAYVVIRRSRRMGRTRGLGGERSGRESVATAWPWPEAPERQVAAHEPLFEAPGWDGEVDDPAWTQPHEAHPPDPGPADPGEGASPTDPPSAADALDQAEAPAPVAIGVDEEQPVVGIEVLESGPFAFGGWAPQSGATSVMGVSFSRRLDAIPEAARIRLDVRGTRNVPAAGIVVLEGEGFAPDREGFAIMIAADAPGSFLANGRWELLAGATE